MDSSDSAVSSDGTALETALAECLESKSGTSPNYRQNFERVVGAWIDFCDRKDVATLEAVSKRTMNQYSAHLARRIEAGNSDNVDGGISATTAWTYYDYVSAFLSWAVRHEYLAENPADKAVARESLPDRPSSGEYDRQYWQPEQRKTVMDFVRRRVDSAYQDPIAPTPILHKRLRDRALVATIAYSGVRGGEVLKDPNDSRRTGLRWSHVDFEEGVAWILGKNQDTEPAQFPEQVTDPLERWHEAYDPPSDDWPVFPSMHVPTLSRRIADALGGDERDRRTADRHHWTVALEAGVEPTSITTEGVRSLMKRLSAVAEVPGLDLEAGEYLTLHGARRGVGEFLYRNVSHEQAQRTLRHADPQTTSEMYSHIDASELADDNTEAFDRE
ncbi:phage integrase SAM-like domain-containing protein [Haloterrigena sp. SYSU A121-1]|uniref:Phage integrase SAM-like domain-containing protein n=1 Tax=Haloterrigena gelatinilytica TaxID=2741724 RepID=A0A8J8KK10_9EURY|nr:tyrosine-type recombinase/integrase [Haloterrigena gelatinilytica]NUB93989.1 phage integrase SAM-like domain-containing protein [Haloterrigena gelatinilytica]